MASPTTAAAPDAPSGSSPLSINGQPRLVGWLLEIVNFIRALVPIGGVYDTGWVAVTPSAGVTVSGGAWVRRIGKLVLFQASTISFASLAIGGSIQLFDALPTGFRTSKTARGGCWMSGGRTGTIGTDSGGAVSIWNQSNSAVTTAQVYLTWTVD